MSAAASTLLSQYNYSVLVAIAPSITGELLPSRNVKWKQVDRRCIRIWKMLFMCCLALRRMLFPQYKLSSCLESTPTCSFIVISENELHQNLENVAHDYGRIIAVQECQVEAGRPPPTSWAASESGKCCSCVV